MLNFFILIYSPVLLQVRARDNRLFTLKCFDDSVHHFKVPPEADPETTRKVSRNPLLPLEIQTLERKKNSFRHSLILQRSLIRSFLKSKELLSCFYFTYCRIKPVFRWKSKILSQCIFIFIFCCSQWSQRSRTELWLTL